MSSQAACSKVCLSIPWNPRTEALVCSLTSCISLGWVNPYSWKKVNVLAFTSCSGEVLRNDLKLNDVTSRFWEPETVTIMTITTNVVNHDVHHLFWDLLRPAGIFQEAGWLHPTPNFQGQRRDNRLSFFAFFAACGTMLEKRVLVDLAE